MILKNMRNHYYLEEKQLVADFHANFQQFIESTDNWKPTKQQCRLPLYKTTTHQKLMCTGILLLILIYSGMYMSERMQGKEMYCSRPTKLQIHVGQNYCTLIAHVSHHLCYFV